MNSGIPDHQLCAVLAIKYDGVAKSMLVKFMGSTRRVISDRTAPKLIEFLDLRLTKTTQEITINKIGIWSGFRKRPEEIYCSFWTRRGKLSDSLVRPNIDFPLRSIISEQWMRSG